MSQAPNPDDLVGVFNLPGEERYTDFLEEVTRQGRVWTLKGDSGFISFSDDAGRHCFPFWPDAACARALATDDWADCQPEPLALDVFMSRWLTGMAKDGRLVAVFPAPDGSGVVIDPEILLKDLKDERDM